MSAAKELFKNTTATATAEDLVKQIKRIDRAAMKTTPSAATTFKRGMPHLVIGRPLLVITQDFVGFADFLEFILGRFVVGIFVRMKLHGLLTISLLNFIR